MLLAAHHALKEAALIYLCKAITALATYSVLIAAAGEPCSSQLSEQPVLNTACPEVKPRNLHEPAFWLIYNTLNYYHEL